MFSFNFDNTIFNAHGQIFKINAAGVQVESNGSPEIMLSKENIDEKVVITAKITNNSNKPITLNKLYFIRNADLKIADNSGDNTVAILQKGECGRNRNMSVHDITDFDVSTIYTVLHKPKVGGLSLGFITFDRLVSKVEFKRTKTSSGAYIGTVAGSNKNNIVLSIYCDFNGFELNPGRSIDSEQFFIEENKDSYSLLESFAKTVGVKYKIEKFAKPPVGWIGGWNFRDGFYKENSEKLIKQNIKAIKTRLSGFGVEYIWVSTVNTKDNLPGNWDIDNQYNFPEGLGKLSEHCKNNKMKLGLWIAPFWMNEASENIKYVENAIAIKNGEKVITEKGRVTHQPFNGKKPEELPRTYYLDPTHPDLHSFLKKTFEYYNKIGISYYMVDFLLHGIDPEYDLYDKTMVNGPESFRSAMKVIRDTVSDGTYLLSSSGPTYYNIGLVDGVRAARDFGEGRPVQKHGGFYPANYLSNDYNLISEVTRDYAITSPNNNRLYANDAFNMITIQKPVPKNEARIICSLFGLSGNPVMMGDDIPTISEERLSMLKKTLPVYGKGMKPCNLFEALYPDAPNIFKLDINKEYDSYSIIAIFNFKREPISEIIEPEKTFGKNEVVIYDFWNEHILGKISGSFTAHIPPRDVKVLRISKARKNPWIVGSDMHISQGGVDISHVRWDEEDMILKGVCHRPEGETGRIYILIPDGYEPVNFRDLYIMREESQDVNPDGSKMHVAIKTIKFDVSTADFYIPFKKRS